MPAIKRGAGKIEEYANKFKNMNQNHNDFEGPLGRRSTECLNCSFGAVCGRGSPNEIF